jgi:hypothetical protein
VMKSRMMKNLMNHLWRVIIRKSNTRLMIHRAWIDEEKYWFGWFA